jgi:hypothetical protein
MVKQKLREFQNKVFRRIFRRNRAEVTGGRKKLHTEELHNLYCSSDIKLAVR